METTAAFRQAMAQIMKSRMAFHGVKQSETAEAIGISQSQLSKILRADRPIDLETFEALCTFLGDDAAALVTQGRALADRSATNDNTDKSQDALADANTSDRAPDMSGWTADEQADYVANHLDQFDYAAKRGNTEAEQLAYEEMP